MDSKNYLDFFNRELNIGDTVAYCRPGYRELMLGTVLSFTPKQVRVTCSSHYGLNGEKTYLCSPSFLIKKV
jgi:hypothetical protein